MGYYLLHPATIGELGPRTKMDSSRKPPRVERLHIEVDSWFGGAVTEVFPCYVVTPTTAFTLKHAKLTGFDLRDMETTAAADAFNLMDLGKLPRFRWLHVSGIAGRDDVGLTVMSALVVSDRAFEALRQCDLGGCGHEVYE